MEINFNWVIPILRIFDIAKADEFYLGFRDFSVDWDRRFDANAPLYRRISRQSDPALKRASRRRQSRRSDSSNDAGC